MTRPPAATQDQDLVGAFLDVRDEGSFLTLYRRHTPAIYALLRRLTGAERDAEELVQETWIRAVQSLPAFRWESSLRTWLSGIAINCHRTFVRRRGRLRLVEADIPAESGADDPALTNAPDALDLEAAIRDLPPGYRDVLVLHDVEGYTHDEIGRLLGIASGTSKSQLHHARRTLRSRLGRRGASARAGDRAV